MACFKIQSGKEHYTGMKNLQLVRLLVQLCFLGLLVAGFYLKLRGVLFFLLPLSLLVGNYFCGWVCPYGTAQEWFGRIGSLIWKRKLKMPQFLQRYAQYFRYLLMASLLILLSHQAAEALPFNAYRSFMTLAGGRTVQTVALVIMGAFLFISFFFERPFCNYVCSEGIRYSVASLLRVFTVKRNSKTCVHCKKCDQACPMNIQVSVSKDGRSAQCINCFQCVSACPVNNTLSYGKVGFIQTFWMKLRGKSIQDKSIAS